MAATLSNEYIPGICNAGPAEIRSKVQLGIFGIGIAVLFIATTFFISVPLPLRMTVFFPIYLGTLCFVQARYRFCVNLGLQGKMNLSPKAGTGEKVQETEYHVQDRSRAQLILLISFFASLAVSAIVIAL